MKVKLCIVITLLATVVRPVFSEVANSPEVAAAPEVVAAPEVANSFQNYVGVKFGSMSISRDIPFDDDGLLLGVLFGYNIPDSPFAIEGEFNTTVSKASSENDSYGDLGVTTLAGYGVYRSPGRVYAKAKVGILYEYLTSSVKGPVTIDVDGSGLAISYGVGGGFRVTDQMAAEIEYTVIEVDIGYLSLGLNWHF